MTKLDDALRLIRSADPQAPEHGLRELRALAEETPNDPNGWFELGGAYDFLGRESEAITHYLRVQSLGIERLKLDEQPRWYLQTGSTLRNLKRYPEARSVLSEGMERFPDNHALRVFLALVLYTEGRFQKSAQHLLSALVFELKSESKTIHEYRRALTGYLENLDTFPESPPKV